MHHCTALIEYRYRYRIDIYTYISHLNQWKSINIKQFFLTFKFCMLIKFACEVFASRSLRVFLCCLTARAWIWREWLLLLFSLYPFFLVFNHFIIIDVSQAFNSFVVVVVQQQQIVASLSICVSKTPQQHLLPAVSLCVCWSSAVLPVKPKSG